LISCHGASMTSWVRAAVRIRNSSDDAAIPWRASVCSNKTRCAPGSRVAPRRPRASVCQISNIGDLRKGPWSDADSQTDADDAGAKVLTLVASDRFCLTAQNYRRIRENVRGKLRTNHLGTKWTATLVAPRRSSYQLAVRSNYITGSILAEPAGRARLGPKSPSPAHLQAGRDRPLEMSHEARTRNAFYRPYRHG